jgi:hypothetical protein
VLKRVRYTNGIAPGCTGEGVVSYVVRGSECTFSGITPEFTSTINAAEYIIRAIAAAERFDPRVMTFFDLITQRGYPSMKGGEYEYKRLKVDYNGQSRGRGIWVDQWTDVECPPGILQLFSVVTN